MSNYHQISRKDTGQTLRLPQDMRWTDEFDWAAVAQAEPERTLSGGIVIQQGLKRQGRPITLAGEWAWLDLATLRTLRDWCDIPELVLRFTHYDGRAFDAVFRLHEQGLAKVTPVHFATPESDTERYTAEICLMTV